MTSPEPPRFSGSIVPKLNESTSSEPKRFVRQNQVPDSILLNKELNKAIEALPSNYNFEVRWRLVMRFLRRRV